VDREGLRVAADPAHLQVDDVATSAIQGLPRRASRADALVEADGSRQSPAQLGVIQEVVVLERLLDHQEREGVELFQVRRSARV
jgi:hypothetical protein